AQDLFGLVPDRDLRLMREGQELNALTASALASMDNVLAGLAPDWVLVQGDTTTAMAASLAAFHRRVRVGHVEAGLRPQALYQPFPEAANRRIADAVASALFAPPARAEAALLAAGCDRASVHRVGNTVVDALQMLAEPLPPVPADHGIE